MKKFTFLALSITFLFSFNNIFAQNRGNTTSTPTSERCGTNEWLQNMIRDYPDFKNQFEENERLLGAAISNYLEQRRENPNRVNAPIIIPVVFHVVLNNQALVPDAMIMNQLTVLNQDFGGTNSDSTNISYAPSFQSVRGHSDIQFCLAQRTPDNLPTNGIVRVTSGTTSSASSNDPIKSTAAGGSDAWDPTQYFNVWIGNFTSAGLLGYGTMPVGSPENPSGSLSQQGVVVLAASLPGGSASPYDLGRTLTHEAGHYFWLYHIWGSSGCDSDFPTTPALDDTPAQSDETFGCPSGAQAAGCGSPNPPGRMYQNFMDYTDDACMSMFTNGQNTRAYQAITMFRPGYITSLGCVPPMLMTDNAEVATINTPSPNFSSCDPDIPLEITIRNIGSNVVNTLTITVKRNGTTVETRNMAAMNLASLATMNVTLNNVPIVLGPNTIEVCTSQPNGNADSDPSNDCQSITGLGGGGQALPLVEGFESVTFPPAGWQRLNPDGGITWQRNTTGVEHGGSADAWVNHYNYISNGQQDDLQTPVYGTLGLDSVWVSFWAAYRGFPGFPFDEFQVLASSDCGQSFQVIYNVRNDTAFVAPPGASSTTTANYAPSNADQWVRKSLDLSNLINNGNVQLRFRAVNRWGNNVFLDDINLDGVVFPNTDAGVIEVRQPYDRICTTSDAPVAVIKNFGKLPLTAVKVNYQIDGAGAVTTINWTGNLARNEIAAVTLPVANYGGNGDHSFFAFTSDPNNVADEDPSNDGLTKPYKVQPILTLPTSVTEDFTNSTFPPANWDVINPDNDLTWGRNGSVGNRSPGSAWFNDWSNNTIDRYDDLALPNYTYSGIDSIFLTFNVAHLTKTLPGTTGSRLDSLSVMISKDCGNTFTTVYKKYGEELQTVNDPNFQTSLKEFLPMNDQWRRDSVNLGQWLGSSEPLVQIAFRFHGNFENNLFLDDVNLRTEILPDRLKADGYLVLPNPFSTAFAVWHYLPPAGLRYINVYNSVGQLVWSKQYKGNAEKYIIIDLSREAAGMYVVNLGYSESSRNVNVQVIKR